MVLKRNMRYLLLALFLITCSPALASNETAWARHFQEAQQAFEQKHFLAAKILFVQAVTEARQCNQDIELADSLNLLANKYATSKRLKVAEALRKQANKIYAERFALIDRSIGYGAI